MSPKPWGKIEVGHMRHPKFLALSGNAIALWDEGKDYCDEHFTDGIIPKEALKTFRFAGPKSLAMLTSSCGQKPDGTPYAPLWEPHAIGYRMHDYLDHNDCRDQHLANLKRAEERRDEDRERKKKARDAKSAKRPHGQNADEVRTRPQEIRSTSETASASEASTSAHADVFARVDDQPKDVWFREFQRLYPEAGRTSGPLAEQAYLAVFGRHHDQSPGDTRQMLLDAIEHYRKSDRWRRGFVKNMTAWLREGLYVQKPDAAVVEPAPQHPDSRGHFPPCRTMTDCNRKFEAEIEARKAVV